MEKRVFCQLNGDRKVIGVLRGYDVRGRPYNSGFLLRLHLLWDIWEICAGSWGGEYILN